ncbi:MAG TPA: hypothetical protein V6C46_09915 [Coleofasciculaceae cyanobacterium]
MPNRSAKRLKLERSLLFFTMRQPLRRQPIQLSPTAILTIILLSLMAIAGLLSTIVGMTIGREALKGVTQPDTRPSSLLKPSKAPSKSTDELIVLREEDILAKVKSRINADGSQQKPVPLSDAKVSTPSNQPGQFPMTNESRGVLLEITSAQRQGDSLILNVTLQNRSQQPVQFLYSLLEVHDDQGQVLNASTDGLPSELPPASSLFSGTISISTSLLEGVKTLSLKLTDYPDQRVRLEAENIPLVK